MPYIQLDLPRDPSDSDFSPVAKGVADLYADVMPRAGLSANRRVPRLV